MSSEVPSALDAPHGWPSPSFTDPSEPSVPERGGSPCAAAAAGADPRVPFPPLAANSLREREREFTVYDLSKSSHPMGASFSGSLKLAWALGS